MIELTLHGTDDRIVYDDRTNQLMRNGVPYLVADRRPASEAVNLRVALGKKCNMGCAYCLQSAAKHQAEPRMDSDELAEAVIRFLGTREISNLSFWGGEPFLYLDEIKLLFDRLKPRFTESGNGNVSIVTNGSLLGRPDVAAWLRANIEDVFITVSYDGPGQHLRGRNVLDDPGVVETVRWLAAENRLGFSTVFTSVNCSLRAWREELAARLGELPDYPLEVDFLQVVDQSSADLAADDGKLWECVLETYGLLLEEGQRIMPSLYGLAESCIARFGETAQAGACHAMSRETLSLDMEGNLLVCQNKTSRDVDPLDGSPYGLANLRDLDPGAAVPVPRAAAVRHRWATVCAACQVRHFCGGGCLVGEEEWQALNCNQLRHKYLLALLYMTTLVTGQAVREVKVI